MHPRPYRIHYVQFGGDLVIEIAAFPLQSIWLITPGRRNQADILGEQESLTFNGPRGLAPFNFGFHEKL
jgi:hypothetical protein